LRLVREEKAVPGRLHQENSLFEKELVTSYGFDSFCDGLALG
jgi:hypothetical protein